MINLGRVSHWRQVCHHLPPFLFSIAIPVLGVKGYPSINLFAVFAARIAALISEIPCVNPRLGVVRVGL